MFDPEAEGFGSITLLPEALEQWSRSLFGLLLPRHLEIVEEINARPLAMYARSSPAMSVACKDSR